MQGINMNIIKKLGLVCALAIAVAACVPMSSNQSIVKTNNGILVSTSNMTLYTFDQDQAGSGKSSCYGDCANNWPPLLVDSNATAYGDYSIITRTDGKKQFAYKGKPLYFFLMDKKPDDRNGNDLLNGAWHIVKM
jgi:predicted lipoprotein with Yx(FWY)xxD motif